MSYAFGRNRRDIYQPEKKATKKKETGRTDFTSRLNHKGKIEFEATEGERASVVSGMACEKGYSHLSTAR